MKPIVRQAVAVFAFALGSMGGSSALAAITLTMDEVENQLIDGLTVSKGGLDFTFSNPAGTLYYYSAGPGNLTYVQDPSIQGDLRNSDGELSEFSVSFSHPVNRIQFGLAEDSDQKLNGARVTLSNGDVLFFDLSLVDPFAEGQFKYAGAPVTGFTVTPVAGDPDEAPFRLAFDNLSVPEPASLALLAIGLAGLGFLRRTKA